jgi:hypothetical protein
VTAATILSPGFGASRGGVTDHTRRLVAHWTSRGVGAAVVEAPADLRPDGGAVLVQYAPRLYGPWGLAPELVRAVAAAHAAGRRVTVFVHEPWLPPTQLPGLVLSPLQRRQLHRLVRHADAVVTPVPAWTARFEGLAETLYVGSTLGIAPLAPPGPMLEAPVVFSPFAVGLDWESILAAEEAIGRGLAVLGATHADAGSRLRLPERARRWRWLGRVPSAAALGILARARLVLAPYGEGLTGRRTAALAALSTGSRLASSRGPLFDPVFDGGPVALSGDPAEFAGTAVRAWDAEDDLAARRDRRAWFDQRFDQRRLDDRLLAIARSPEPR